MNIREILLTAIRKCDRTQLYVDSKPLTLDEQKQLEDMEHRLDAGEPLQYILGFTEFMGLRINVDKRVLIPRPETEMLVERAIDHFKNKNLKQINVLELGTGSGNIAIALASFLPNARIVSVDVSIDAIKLAAENAKLNCVENRIDFVHMDMKEYLFIAQKFSQTFDLIISNPPYIRTTALALLPCDVKKEPRLALDGGEDGLLFYRTIIKNGLPLLSIYGLCLLEFGDGQQAFIQKILENQDLNLFIRFHKDYTQRLRIAEISYQPTTIEIYG